VICRVQTGCVADLLGGRARRWNIQQLPAECQLLGAVTVGKKAVMANAVEPVGQGVEEKAPDELVGVQGHDLRLAVVAIILPVEGDVFVGHADQSGVGDGNTVGIAAEIGQHLGGSAEGRLGKDDPFELAQFAQPAIEGRSLGETGKIAEEAEIAGCEGGAELIEEQPAEEAREYTHRQEEAGSAADPARSIRRRAAARHDAMNMGMMLQGLAPSVKHGDQANLRTEVPGVGGDRSERLGRGSEQDGVDRLLVLEGNLGRRCRQCEHHMEVRNWQQFGLPRCQPVVAGLALTLRAVPIAAGNGRRPLPALWAKSVMGSR
jgi:hypothetical protein